MNKLTIFEKNGFLWTDSREVAEMVGKQHKNLLADIRGYILAMEKSDELKIQPVDFFMESTYVDEKQETRPCFLISKKGCEMVANKLTGDKGVLFTAAYVTRFNEMEKGMRPARPLCPPKSSSVGEIASLVKINQLIMSEQKSSPSKIARQTELFYEYAGLPIIPSYSEPSYEQMTLTSTTRETTTTVSLPPRK